MHFRLVENRIDDLRRLIARDIEKKKISELIGSEIDNISLISVEEASNLSEDIRVWPKNNPNRWWLCSPGYFSPYAANVTSDGYINHKSNCRAGWLVDLRSGIRPALYLKYKILVPYNQYNVYEEPWIAISEDCLLYNGKKYVEHIFDEKTNIYDDSEIKRYLESGEWLDSIKSMKE